MPVTTSPVLTPMRSSNACRSRSSSSFSSSRPPRSSSAARTARRASSSCTVGHAEDRHHRVADELLHGPAVPLDDRLRRLEVACHHPPQALRVEPLPECGRAGDVAEEHVTSLRTSRAGADSASAAPQESQKRAPPGSRPHSSRRSCGESKSAITDGTRRDGRPNRRRRNLRVISPRRVHSARKILLLLVGLLAIGSAVFAGSARAGHKAPGVVFTLGNQRAGTRCSL